MVGSLAEDVLILAVVLCERGDEGVDFGGRHVAAEFAVGGELLQQTALAGGGGGLQVFGFGFFGLLVGVGRTVFAQCLMHFGFPCHLGFLEGFLLIATLAVVIFLGGIEQAEDECHDALSGCCVCHEGMVEVGRVEGVLVEEADTGEEGAATVKAAKQRDVAFARVGSVLHTVFQKLGQTAVCAVGNVGRLGTKFVVFFQQIFFFGARIGRLGGVIREMNPI